jgi:hypothetical protein
MMEQPAGDGMGTNGEAEIFPQSPILEATGLKARAPLFLQQLKKTLGAFLFIT